MDRVGNRGGTARKLGRCRTHLQADFECVTAPGAAGGDNPIAFLDVFAERPLAGNGLAVVDDADDVGDELMLTFARETRLSETTYLQSATDDGADYRNRIWTPGEELPFAGHPSRGPRSRCALARARGGGVHAADRGRPAADRRSSRR